MKKALFILLLLVGCSPRFLPQTAIGVEPLPKGKYAHRATEGGGMEVPIDTVTALDTLIHRLNGKFPFVETGKAYFIGYTNDQFSIAAHGEAAIPALMHYIKTDADPLGKMGATYALHLIGINSKVAGRFYEEFSNIKAREALRELLQMEEFQDEVMELLKRDPWQSDVPYLFGIISQSPADNWPIINCLTRYSIPGIPFHEKIPSELAAFPLEPSLMAPRASRQVYDDNWKGLYEKQALEIVAHLSKINNNSIVVDTSLLHSKLFGTSYFDLNPTTHWTNGKSERSSYIPLDTFFERMTNVEYCGSNGSRIQYYIENNRLHICSTVTAKRRLLTWWNNLPLEQRNSFTQNAGPR